MNVEMKKNANLIREFNMKVSKKTVDEFLDYGIKEDFILDITYQPYFLYNEEYECCKTAPFHHSEKAVGKKYQVSSIRDEGREQVIISDVSKSCQRSTIDYLMSLDLSRYKGIIIYDDKFDSVYESMSFRDKYIKYNNPDNPDKTKRYCLIEKDEFEYIPIVIDLIQDPGIPDAFLEDIVEEKKFYF